MIGVPLDRDLNIYHCTHVDNLPSILADRGLRSDAAMVARGGPAVPLGMATIKERRRALPLKCHPGDRVADYVSFYFCPCSVLLYFIHRANHAELTYRGGQDPIVHLEAELLPTMLWAIHNNQRWAFSLSNAGAAYAEFRDRLDQLGDVDWEAVAARDFRDPRVKEGKQAEFLVRGFFPWHLVRRIGVDSQAIGERVMRLLAGSRHQPLVLIPWDWYFRYC